MIYLHCLKSNYLVKKTKEISNDYIDQDQIFKVFDQASEVPVLASFPQLLKYFYKFQDFLDLIEMKVEKS